MPGIRRLIIVALALAGLVAGTSAAAVTDPLNGPYPQVHGEMVTGIPATAACTTTIVKDFRFHNTAYWDDPPFTGDYVPSCSGPWSKVVLTMSAAVRTGTQFDRTGDVLIGGVELLHFTTPEGEAGETDWTIQRDVTAYAGVLTQRQPTYFIIGNQTDDTYTGDFYGSLALTFYAVGATAPAAPTPTVIGLNEQLNRGLPTVSAGKQLTTRVAVPVNTTQLTAEVFASGHGAEEEDWWNAPFACVSGGIPYREVGVRVDGQLAGIAPVFPTIYTGGYGPDFWRPIPSPRALNMRPYELDLSPWIGLLTDGHFHEISLGVIGQDGCEGYWFLGGNLLATTNTANNGRTLGAITSYDAAALPTSTTLGAQADTLSDRTTSAHHLDVTGWIRPAGALAPTTVHVVEDMTNEATDAALDVVSDWTWDSSTTRTAGGAISRSSQHSTYQLLRTGPTWSLTDDQDTTEANGRTTSLRDTMTTAGPVLGITGLVGASKESWRYTTSDQGCVDHELVAAVQNTVVDTVSSCD